MTLIVNPAIGRVLLTAGTLDLESSSTESFWFLTEYPFGLYYSAKVLKISELLRPPAEITYLYPLALSLKRAKIWATAESLTSTTAYPVSGSGIPGKDPLRILYTNPSLELPWTVFPGPITIEGFTTQTSISFLWAS